MIRRRNRQKEEEKVGKRNRNFMKEICGMVRPLSFYPSIHIDAILTSVKKSFKR